MLGEGKRKRRRKTVIKQKGCFVAPIVAALAPTAIDLVKKLIREKMARRDRIVMVKQQTPKKVTLPNGRTFYARYKRATRTDLLPNVHLEQPYKQRAAPKGRRCQVRQGERGFKSVFGKLKRFAEKVGNNKAFKNVAGAVLKEVPGAIGNLSKRVSNKKLKSILDSDITRTVIELATGYALDKRNN